MTLERSRRNDTEAEKKGKYYSSFRISFENYDTKYNIIILVGINLDLVCAPSRGRRLKTLDAGTESTRSGTAACGATESNIFCIRLELMCARSSPNFNIVSHDLLPSINLFYVHFLFVGNLIFLPRCSGMCSAAPRVKASAQSSDYHCLRNRHSVRRHANKFAAIVTHLVVIVDFFGAPKAAVKLRQLRSIL